MIGNKSRQIFFSGVQLLCLIGKGLDACRYLTSYGLWERAAWLAKSVLPQGELGEVLKKWAENLAANGQRVSYKTQMTDGIIHS